MKTQLLLEAAKEVINSRIPLPHDLREKLLDGIAQAQGDPVKRVSSDKSLKRFRIVTESGAKYKTTQFSKEQFNKLKDNTPEQWDAFLKDYPSEYQQYQRPRKGS